MCKFCFRYVCREREREREMQEKFVEKLQDNHDVIHIHYQYA